MMTIKKKVIILLIILCISILYFVVGSSYASYSSAASGSSQPALARFKADNLLSSSLSFNIDDMALGDSKDFTFDVNTVNEDVSIKYKIYVKSYSLPFTFSLKKGNNATNLLQCSGLVHKTCVSSELSQSYGGTQQYTLVVSLPDSDDVNDYDYSNNIDKIDLTIDSWQNNS